MKLNLFPRQKLYVSGATMSGGPLDQEYDIAQLHFHWGSHNIRGSEHLLNGKRSNIALECLPFLSMEYFQFPTRDAHCPSKGRRYREEFKQKIFNSFKGNFL